MTDMMYLFYKKGEQYLRYKNQDFKCIDPVKVSQLLKDAFNPKNTSSNIENTYKEIEQYIKVQKNPSSEEVNILDYAKKGMNLTDTFISEQRITLEDAKELRKNLEQTLELTEDDLKEIHNSLAPQNGLIDISVILYIVSILISSIALIILKSFM